MPLTDKQNYAFQSVAHGNNVFITGPGGTGKTTLISKIVKHIGQFKRIGVTSTTGVSALLVGGTTLHSYLGIGVGAQDKEGLLKKVKAGRQKNRWTQTDMLIIDEVSMLSAELFDKLNYVAKNMRKSVLPFGGMQLVLSGDLCQLPFIGNNTKFCFESECWDECINETIYLSELLRQNNHEFKEILNRIRLGQHTRNDIKYIKNNSCKTESDLKIPATKLFCKNVDVDEINLQNLYEIEANEIYKYEMKTKPEPGIILRPAFNPMKKCNAPDVLKLCVGAQVMLLYNKDVAAGLVNGSKGVVVRFEDTLPVVKFYHSQLTLKIGYKEWEIKDGSDIVATITQIPLKLAYAITVHKSQGITLDSAVIDLKDVFEYGQAYVALSRVRSLENLVIKNFTWLSFKAHPKAVTYYTKM